MKHLKPYIVIAILSLSIGSSHSAFANSVKPVKGIDVVICATCQGRDGSRTIATPTKDGGLVVELPGPGTWQISYGSGPKKGQLIKKVTVAKAGPVRVSASATQ